MDRNPAWLELAAREAWEELQLELEANKETELYSQYANDAAKFGNEILGEHYTDDIKRVMTSVRDYPVTIAKSSNAVGKSHGAARIAVHFYFTHPGAKVFITAAPPLENLKRILWGEIMSVVMRNGDLFQNHKVRSLSIYKSPEEFITGVAIPTSGTKEEREAKFSGKHAPNLLFIVDEGDAVPDEVYDGIESCISGGNARLLIMFNPRAQRGPVWIKERDHLANIITLSALDHPNVRSGQNIIEGAVTQEMTVQRINEWTRSLAPNEKVDDSAKFVIPAFLIGKSAFAPNGKEYPSLVAETRRIIDPRFSYMVLGEYPAAGPKQLISLEWINNARSRYDLYVAKHGQRPPEGTKPIMSLDVAEFGPDANVACFRYGGYVPPMITWNGVDPDKSAIKGVELYTQYDADMIMVDGTGLGSSVAPSMARMSRDDDNSKKVRSFSVKVASSPSRAIVRSDLGEFKILRDQLWWAVREWLKNDPGAMLPPDEKLIEELMTPTYDNPKGKIMVMSKEEMRQVLKRSPDRADALCLTFAPFAKPQIIRLIG